jgi:hypothetical protein
MRALSISAAWEEAKAILARDGRLFAAVALALVALPAVISTLINPGGMSSGSGAAWLRFVALIASLIQIAGQLALIRLAIGPSVTVGGAIAHGFRRLPIYFVAVLILVAALFLALIPAGLLLNALGVPLTAGTPPMSPPVVLVMLFYCALVLFFGVRFLMTSSVASAEDVGPIAILTRSWRLTAGYWWPLFGFLVMFLIAAVILLIAVGSAVGVVVRLLFGSIQPMSASALILALVQSLISAGVTILFAVMLARIYVQLAGRGEAQVGVPSSGI